MRKTSVQNFSRTLCVRVATCACRSSTSRGAWVAFDNKNKPVSLPVVVTICTVGGRLPAIFYLEKHLRSFNLSIFFKLLLPQE